MSPQWTLRSLVVVVVCLQHALVNDGVTSRLANHQIGPLYDDNTREEGRVTRELQHFTLRVRLFINEEKKKKTNSQIS